jgi:RNA polymerase sigma-70 factor (ECF subfamily)
MTHLPGSPTSRIGAAINHETELSRNESVIQSLAAREVRVTAAPRTGSTMAFDELQKVYSSRLFKTILRITKNWEDAEDALQDTFLRAYLALHCFEGRSSVYSWLTRIAINSALMVLRRRRSRLETLLICSFEEGDGDSPLELKDSSSNPEQLCDLRQRKDHLLKAIRNLETPLRAPIEAQLAGEHSVKEVAGTLNISVAGQRPGSIGPAFGSSNGPRYTPRRRNVCQLGLLIRARTQISKIENSNGQAAAKTKGNYCGQRAARHHGRARAAFVCGLCLDVLGSEGAKLLEDIWLDELAEMERTPEPTSRQWRLVSIAASSRLAGRLMDLNHDRWCF